MHGYFANTTKNKQKVGMCSLVNKNYFYRKQVKQSNRTTVFIPSTMQPPMLTLQQRITKQRWQPTV
jgi:hypothetical protein